MFDVYKCWQFNQRKHNLQMHCANLHIYSSLHNKLDPYSCTFVRGYVKYFVSALLLLLECAYPMKKFYIGETVFSVICNLHSSFVLFACIKPRLNVQVVMTVELHILSIIQLFRNNP